MGHRFSKLLQPFFFLLLVITCTTTIAVLWSTLYLASTTTFNPVPSHCIPRTSSKDIVFRSAYFDSRPRHGHTNASVFILEVRKTVLDFISGCSVGGNVAQDFQVRSCNNNRFHHRSHPQLTHDQVMLDCFDLPVKNGSRAFVMYTANASAWLSRKRIGHQRNPGEVGIAVESEQPLFIPPPPKLGQMLGQRALKIAVCAAVLYDSPPFLSDWLRYQRVIGVDHVHIIGEESFQMSGGLNGYFRRAVREGYVTLEVWHPWLSECETRYHSQMVAYEDCIYRLRGTYDYIFMLDVDDFFVPLVKGQPKLSYYVKKWCHQGSCTFQWTEFYPDCGLKDIVSKDGNVTNLLTFSVHNERIEGKSLHKLSAILDAGIHRPAALMDGYTKTMVPQNQAYVAHIRKGRIPFQCNVTSN